MSKPQHADDTDQGLPGGENHPGGNMQPAIRERNMSLSNDALTFVEKLRTLADNIEKDPKHFQALATSLQQAQKAAAALKRPGAIEPRDIDWAEIAFVAACLLF